MYTTAAARSDAAASAPGAGSAVSNAIGSLRAAMAWWLAGCTGEGGASTHISPAMCCVLRARAGKDARLLPFLQRCAIAPHGV